MDLVLTSNEKVLYLEYVVVLPTRHSIQKVRRLPELVQIHRLHYFLVDEQNMWCANEIDKMATAEEVQQTYEQLHLDMEHNNL